MKKILSIIICVVILTGCGKVDKLKKDTKYNLNEKVEIELEKNDEKSKVVKDKKDESQVKEVDEKLENKGVKLTQLPGYFYNIEDISKEYRDIRNIKNYKNFDFDLDFDGKIDRITLKRKESDHIIEYNGKEIELSGYMLGDIGIVDIDDQDNKLEIWVFDFGASDDFSYHLFRKVGDDIIELYNFPASSFLLDGKGKIVTAHRNYNPWTIPQVYDCYYTIENNKVIENNLDFSYNENFEYKAEELFFTTDIKNVYEFEQYSPRYEEEDRPIIAKKYNIKKLNKNTKFKILEFVKDYSFSGEICDLKIILSDGTVGYLIHPYCRFMFYG